MFSLGSLSLLCAFCFLGSFIQRVTGFGFGIFVMTVFPCLLPSYGEATMLSGLLAGTNSLMVVLQKRRFIQWKNFFPMLLCFMLVSVVCIFLLVRIDDHLIKKVLGILLVLGSLYFLFFNDKIRLKPNIRTQLSMGTLSGMMGGFFAMQGPPAVLYFMALGMEKNAYIACMQTYLLSGNLLMSVARGYHGFLTCHVGFAYCVGFLFVLGGNWLGGKIFDKISPKILRRCVYGYLALSGTVIYAMA